MSHYFTNDEGVKSDEKTFQAEVLGKVFKFITDSGVFSKGELDLASRILIETFAALNLPGDVLDVGCGYGPIGISLASARPENTVHMVDVNLRAIDLAKRNAELNGIKNIQAYESFCYENVKQTFTHIISNPPIRAGKKVVHQIIEEATDHLEADGTLTIVIGKQHGAASAQKKMEEVFHNVQRLERKKGFWVLQSVKKH
ncbi:MAG: class I SAM-dependent methyltransferase [Turicibacter sp.]|nr:class I SAM-dependent methyltransferase [Turicibacter sp.]